MTLFSDGALQLDLRVYSIVAIQKAAYRLAARFTAELGAPQDERLPLTLRFKPGTSEGEALEAKRLFLEELLDQQLREEIGRETQPIRSLILAHAFSKVDVVKRD